MKKNIKSNKVLLVLFAIVVICFIFLIYGVVKYFFTGTSKNIYGDRLEEVAEHKLPKDINKKITTLYESDKSVEKVEYNLQGRIIYISIDFVKSTALKNAKSSALKSLELFEEDIKSFYDIQYVLTMNTDESSTLFPTMGYKNNSSSQVIWING